MSWGFLARKAGVPVVAARMYGTETILPKGKRLPAIGKIRVVFAKVDTIEPSDTNKTIVAKVMAKIKSL